MLNKINTIFILSREAVMTTMRSKKKFSITTIAGYRYDITMREVFEWFSDGRLYLFLLISESILIFLLPHNISYGLDMSARLIFWPVMTLFFILIYIVTMHLGSLYARASETRSYYSPIGMLIATSIATLSGSYLCGFLTASAPDFSIYKIMEILVNLVLACIFEGAYLAYSGRRLRNKNNAMQHEWEEI